MRDLASIQEKWRKTPTSASDFHMRVHTGKVHTHMCLTTGNYAYIHLPTTYVIHTQTPPKLVPCIIWLCVLGTHTSFSPRVRPLSDGNSPWSSVLIKSQNTMPLASLFVDQPGNFQEAESSRGVSAPEGSASSHVTRWCRGAGAGPLQLYWSPRLFYIQYLLP